MSKGGGGTTTVTQNNEPPSWAKPLFKKSAGIATDLYDSGAGFNPWPGSTIAEGSEATKLGQQGLQNVALAPETNELGMNPVNLANQVTSQGGLMAPAQDAMGFFGDVAGGGMNPDTGMFYDAANSAFNPVTMQATSQFGGLHDRATGGTPASEHYTSMARGDNLAEGNPYFRQLLENEAERLGDQVAGQFSSAGRYGSGANQDVLGRTVGDFMLSGLGQDFDRERGYQMQAIEGLQGAHETGTGQALQSAGGLAGLGQNLFGNLMSGASNIYGAENQNLQNRIGAAQGASDISNQGLQNALGYVNALPTIQQNRTFGANLMQQVGAQQDQAAQAQLNDLISQFYQRDMAPWARLGGLQAAAAGSAGPYGTMHQQTQQPSNFNPLSLLGGAMSLATPFF